MARPVTLVTGASSGLGAAFARACALRGEELVLVARRKERLEALAAELGAGAHVVTCDLAQTEAPERLIADVAERGLSVATLINNAGFGLAGNFADLPLDRQREIVRVNVEALTALTGLALPAMVERRSGAILNVASTAAFQPGPGIAVYFASKAYVLSFSEALHQELKGTGVRVSALCPGPTATEFGEVAGVTSTAFQWLAADAAQVVKAGLDGLDRNQAVVIPGAINKLTAQSPRLLPRAVMRRIVAAVKL
jgi:short-subunit dehydrogenase